jgi:lipopolysaccharide/colanic/teichoic acid biosynthesis glycosyltransferase
MQRDKRAVNQREQTGLPRYVEIPAAIIGLLILSPLFIIVALAILITSGRPIIFSQRRVGRGGALFSLYKFRTMISSINSFNITAHDDDRITAIGRVLRKSKIDEIPSLWNVLKGDMSFVGPRPEVTEHVDLQSAEWQKILQARPGLTDPITLRLRDEEKLLGSLAPAEREEFYKRHLQPYKLAGYCEFLKVRSWSLDLKILGYTILAIIRIRKNQPLQLDEIVNNPHSV